MCVESGADRHSATGRSRLKGSISLLMECRRRERNISRHGTVTGKLRWSPRFDFHVEADGGGYWMLDVPSRMTAEVDALIYTRVIVRGIRIGFADLYLLRIEEDFRPDR